MSTNDVTMAQGEGWLHRVLTRVQKRIGGQLRDFCITIQEDGLVLQGRVSAYYSKQMAQEAAREVSRLVIAANEIQVIEPDSGWPLPQR